MSFGGGVRLPQRQPGTLRAKHLNSEILPNGSSAELVCIFADDSNALRFAYGADNATADRL